jgi:hypothetical protein
MQQKRQTLFLATVVAILLLTGCARVATAPGPGGTIINSDSIVTATIQAIRQQTSGYPWELDILIQDSVNVGSLPNPTKDSVGKVITVETDQNIISLKVNDVITAKVKYVGDVPKPGITLYIYNIELQKVPK